MKTLLVTGQMAKTLVKKYCDEAGVEADVEALPMPVAALMKPKYITRHLSGRDLKGYSMILLPGLIAEDVSVVEEVTRIPTFKGPRYAGDIPAVFEALPTLKLSKIHSADDLMREELKRKAFSLLKDVEKQKDSLLKKPGNMRIGDLALGKDFPTRVMAEIVDAPLLSDEEIRRRAVYYVESGAEVVDVGMVAGESRPEDAARAVKAVKKALNIPVSIDTMDPAEAEAAVSAGADLIISVDEGNMKDISLFAAHLPIVVIPTNFQRKIFPKLASERVAMLERNLELANRLGFTKILADPILDPIINPGVAESLTAYHEFRRRNPYTSIFMGVGNVTELLDADTPGVNAFLAGVATELDIGVILTTEVSDKNKGCVRELSTASRMMFIAKMKECVPKRIGIDLLLARDRTLREEPYNSSLEEDVEVVKAEASTTYKPDPKGCFKILVDREQSFIITAYYSSCRMEKPDLIVKGRAAREVYETIVRRGLISKLDHAAYLGCEVQKAETALKLGKSYIQDTPLY